MGTPRPFPVVYGG